MHHTAKYYLKYVAKSVSLNMFVREFHTIKITFKEVTHLSEVYSSNFLLSYIMHCYFYKYNSNTFTSLDFLKSNLSQGHSC